MAPTPEPRPPLPGVDPRMTQNRDPDYREDQDGSTPLDTVSVPTRQEREVWPVIWAVVTIALVLVTLYLIFG